MQKVMLTAAFISEITTLNLQFPVPFKRSGFSVNRLFILLFIILSLIPSLSFADVTVIDTDTLWSGEIVISDDVLVRPGATLTVAPGTVIRILPSESSKTEPQYLSSYTEITVRGTMNAVGSKVAPIRFLAAEVEQVKEWAGIYVDQGSVTLAWTVIEGADSALTVIKGEAAVTNSTLRKNRYGITVIKDENTVRVDGSTFAENDYGIALLNGATVEQNNCTFSDNEQQDIIRSVSQGFQPPEKEYTAEQKEKVSYYTNESLLSTVVWKDRVVIDGVVRVPAKSKLIIMPGTVVEFKKRDTNGDGIGENGLLIMGMLIAKGTAEQPIIFRSAEQDRKPGDWDAINIYSSDGVQNLIEYCQIENGFRALHFHFSNVAVHHSILRNNFRGMQFQESLIELTETDIYANKSSIRARDSEIYLTGNRIYNNYVGPNVFRVTGAVQGNIIADNSLDGLRIREGALEVRQNDIIGNRYGLTVAYAVYGSFNSNVVADNLESGITLKGTDAIEVADNFVQANGGNGISLLNSQALIKGNYISENGERGIGIISFMGIITENSLLNNRLYGIGLDGENDVYAPGNWWGNSDIDTAIFDKNDDPTKGVIDYQLPAEAPIPFVWPTDTIRIDSGWTGEIHLTHQVTVAAGNTLTIAPGSIVKIAEAQTLWVSGNINAIGEPDRRILFTRLEKKEKVFWEQVITDVGKAVFVNCDFEYAIMGVHSHFANVQVRNCTFRNNESGFRFRGGPVELSNSIFERNTYGIVSYLVKARVSGNTFTQNDIGILVRDEKEGGLVIRHNNIYDNVRYNLRMGDFNTSRTLDARENWWGDNGPEKIHDERLEPDIGIVLYEPYAEKPFESHTN